MYAQNKCDFEIYVSYCTCIVSQVEDNLPEIPTCDIFPCATYTILNSISDYIFLYFSYDVFSTSKLFNVIIRISSNVGDPLIIHTFCIIGLVTGSCHVVIAKG